MKVHIHCEPDPKKRQPPEWVFELSDRLIITEDRLEVHRDGHLPFVVEGEEFHRVQVWVRRT